MVRAQSLVRVSLLSSGLMASPASTRNTATCAVVGDRPRGQPACLNTSAHPVFLSLPPNFPPPFIFPLPICALPSLPFPSLTQP